MIVGTKLEDPEGLLDEDPERLRRLNKKLSAILSMLSLSPKNGGQPFLFSLAASKPHVLTGSLPTAATDGKKYYWNPDFFEKLTPYEAPTVASHEVYHWICDHVNRGKGYKKKIWAMAIDYVVNALVEKDHRYANTGKQLWGGNLGEPIPLQKLLDWIDGNDNAIPKESDDEKEKKWQIYADPLCINRSPESIYAEIIEHVKGSPRKCNSCYALSLDPKTGKSINPKPWGDNACSACGTEPDNTSIGDGLGNSLDSHLDPQTTTQETITEIMRAAEQASQMRGKLPSSVEDILQKLTQPQLTFTDLIRCICMKKSNKAGLRNNWKRPKRKALALDMYIPSRVNYKPTWVCLLDTSGSMSGESIAFCLSQLLSLGGETDGIVVPCDAKVHWDSCTKISTAKDLEKIKIVGRGGTVFNEFFEEFPSRLGTNFDACIVLTDGYVGTIPNSLNPPMPVVWVVDGNTNYKPSFGRVVSLYK